VVDTRRESSLSFELSGSPVGMDLLQSDWPRTAVSGEGAFLIDSEGKRYLDACGGAAVSCLGHAARPVLEAAKAQLDQLAYAHTSFFTSEPAEELAEMLVARAPEGIERVYFVSGGSEAMEAAIKLARQYFIETGKPERTNIIARRQSYHGNTLGALSAGGNEWRREPFAPMLSQAMHHIDPAHYWRWGEDGESMCGMGRTGTLFASEQEGIAPDIVCIAKGLGAGIQPVGAMLCTAAIHDAISAGSGFFQHGHTYLGHPVACAAGIAVIKEIEGRDLLKNVSEAGAELLHQLRSTFGQHPHIGDIRGRGLFQGLELVADRQSKDPLEPEKRTAQRLKKIAMEHGLMCYPMQGTIDGQRGDHILLAPPFIVESAEIEMICERLDASFTELFSA